LTIDSNINKIINLNNIGANMIEYDVPIEDNRSVTLPRETMRAMGVGDSVLIDCTDVRNIQRARTSANIFSQLTGVKFKTRKVQGGLRIWRIA